MYSRILVPLDGSPQSELALSHAAELARRYDAELLLLSGVAPPTHLAAAEASDDGADLAKARDYLAQVGERMQATGVRSRPLVLRAEPARAIVSAAAEHDADLIVIASYSESGFDRWVQGSVPGRVLRNARCPLLLIRWEEPEEAAG